MGCRSLIEFAVSVPGDLADVAPTVLAMLGIENPDAMAGDCLLTGNLPAARSVRLGERPRGRAKQTRSNHG